MRRKIVSAILVLLMLFALAAPAFAAAGTVHPDFNRDKLRSIVAGQASSVSGIVAGVLSADAAKDLAKGAITNMMNFSEIGGLAGPAIGALLEEALKGSLGASLPPGADIGSVVTDVLTSDIVASILSSGFVSKVVDKTIENLLDSLDVKDVLDAVTEGIVDKLTDEIWRDGNPTTGSYTVPYIGTVVQSGHWNTTGGWNTTNIGITITAKLGTAGIAGHFDEYADLSAIDFVRILGVDTIVRAHTKAVKDVAAMYFETYKPMLLARVQEWAGMAKDSAKTALVGELNKIFNLKLSILDDLDGLEAKIVAHIRDAKLYPSGSKERILKELKDLKTAISAANKYKGLDLKKVAALLDKLIKCMEEGKEKPPVVDPVLPVVEPSASVEKLNGNKNNLTITLVERFADGSTKKLAEKTFSINNNAADTYEVGGYKVYVDTKGNTQIRDCHIVP